MTPDLNNEENPRIKSIVNELCNQLAINREQTRLLKKQLNELKVYLSWINDPFLIFFKKFFLQVINVSFVLLL